MTSKAERTREAILVAGEELFSANGFDGTSLDAIGARAGIQGSAILYHFPTKRDLYAAVLDRIFAPLSAEIDELLDRAGEPTERLGVVASALVRFAHRRPAAARLILRETVAGSDDAHVVIGAASAARWERLLALLGEARGDHEGVDPDVLWSIVLGSICFYFASGTSLSGLPADARGSGDIGAFESVLVEITAALAGPRRHGHGDDRRLLHDTREETTA